jgi:hypothetical protein
VANNLLFDPPRGFIYPRDPVTGLALVDNVATDLVEGEIGVMRKPSLRIPEFGGTPL